MCSNERKNRRKIRVVYFYVLIYLTLIRQTGSLVSDLLPILVYERHSNDGTTKTLAPFKNVSGNKVHRTTLPVGRYEASRGHKPAKTKERSNNA